MNLIGVQRGAFSNEAGIGTEALAYGAAKSTKPVREGLVAMTGPIIDTLLICSATAFASMAVPTMVSTLILAPRVMAAARTYFEERAAHGRIGRTIQV